MLRRLPARLSSQEWRDLARAQAAVLRAHLVVRFTPRGRLAALAQPGAAPDVPLLPPPPPAVKRRAHALAHAVHRASRYGLTRPWCLTRAVALLHLLRAEGITGASLRVGVRREAGAFAAHAWVELAGAVVDVAPDVSSYVPLADMALLDGQPGRRR